MYNCYTKRLGHLLIQSGVESSQEVIPQDLKAPDYTDTKLSRRFLNYSPRLRQISLFEDRTIGTGANLAPCTEFSM